MLKELAIDLESEYSLVHIKDMPPATMSISGPVKITGSWDDSARRPVACIRADYRDYQKPTPPSDYILKYKCGDILHWHDYHFMVTARNDEFYSTMCLQTGNAFEFGALYADQEIKEKVA